MQGVPDCGKHEDNRNYEHGENSDEANQLDDSPKQSQDEHEKIQGERFYCQWSLLTRDLPLFHSCILPPQ